MSQIILNFILILIFSLSIFNQINLVRTNVPNDNFYDLLGINKDADNREIRKAFKKLALKLHPDKNKDDSEAHDKFLRINRAYEVLKDDETRKIYDVHGEEGLKDDFKQRGYHSWKYYNEQFGIYDNDEEIITLSRMDFDQSVRNSPYIWFINFYSPQCSHCHHLAPEWRKLAKELEGVIRIGAVNCEEDWMLCRQEGVHSYPSLLVYPQHEKYNGRREADFMAEFILEKLNDKFIQINNLNYQTFNITNDQTTNKANRWVIVFCYEDKDCLFADTRKKLSSMLDGLANIGEANCKLNGKLACDYFQISDSKIVLFNNLSDKENYFEIIEFDRSIDAKDIFKNVLTKLPHIKKLSHKEVKQIIEDLKSNTESHPWLFYFSNSDLVNDNFQIEIKRLPSLLMDVNIGKINCSVDGKICSQFHINKYPSFAVIKKGSTYEIYHGRKSAHDIANFVRESLSSSMQTLDPEYFENKIFKSSDSEKPWFVDFFAPWCPPCMNLLPEVRKVSRKVGYLVNFGTIDCTVHQMTCRKYNIHTYPTVLIYNSSKPHQFYGSHTEHDLIQFIEETLHPSVVSLTPESFDDLVKEKSNNIWLVDYYAPWCGPCQQLTPQWRKLARLLKEEPDVLIGQIDCQMFRSFCSEQGVNSYPTIILYQTKSSDHKFYTYNGQRRDAVSLRIWVYNYISSVVREINTMELYKKVLKSKNVWLIDFYAPWCGHCQTFAPEFQLTAKKLKNLSNSIKTGKVNCQEHNEICHDAGVHAYPTLKLYLPSHNEQNGITIQAYSSETIINYIKEQLNKINKPLFKDEL